MAEFVGHRRHSYRFNANKKNKQTFSKLSTLRVENTFCLHIKLKAHKIGHLLNFAL